MKAMISNAWTKRRREWAKRRTAALLCVVMLAQTLFSGGTVTAFGATENSGANDLEYEITDKSPAEAFADGLKFQVFHQVTDGGGIQISLEGALDTSWIMMKYEAFLDNDGLDEQDYDDGYPIEDDGKPAKELYESYDDYLKAKSGDMLAPMSFSVSFEKGLLDESLLGSGGDLTTRDGEGEVFGTWVVKEDTNGNYRLSVQLKKLLYYRQDAVLGMSAELALSEWYEPGTEIEGQESTNGADINLSIKGGGGASSSDADYSLKKSVMVDGNTVSPDTTLTGRDFSYVLTATTSNYVPADKFLPAATNSNYRFTGASDSNMDVNPDVDLDDLILDEDMLDYYSNHSESDSEYEDEYYDSDEERGFWGSIYRNVLGQRDSGDADADLRGKQIVDTLPANLQLEAVEIRLKKDGGWQPLDSGDYAFEDHVFKYTMGEGLTLEDERSLDWLELKMDVRLSDELYQNHMTSGGKHAYAFPNRAFIKDEAEEKTVAVSNRVNPKIELDESLTKDEDGVDTTDGTFKWKISVNAQFHDDRVKLWVVDHIEDIHNTHMFDIEKGIDLNVGKSDATHANVKLLKLAEGTEDEGTITETLPYNEINWADHIKGMLGEDRYNASSSENAYLYDYETEDGKTDAIMLIPLHTDYLNGKVDITYSTKIGDKYLEDPTNFGKDLHMENQAKVLWSWPRGEGVDPWYGDTADITKGLETQVNLLTKAAGEFNGETGLLPWEFKVNEAGVAVQNAVFYDDFADSEQELQLTDDEALILTHKDGTTTTSVPKGTADTATPYYTYEETPAADGKKAAHRLSIYFGNLAAADYYEFSLNVKVKDTMAGGNSALIPVTNTGHLKGTIGEDTGVDVPATANTQIENVWIKKTAEPISEGSTAYYDYDIHCIRWKVVVNPKNKNADIKDAKVKDELPEGVKFAVLESVEKGYENPVKYQEPVKDENGIWTAASPEGDTSQTVTLTATDPGGETSGSFTASLGDIKEQWTLTFTTEVTEDFRKAAKTGSTYDFKNKATLTGTVSGAEISPSDTATVPITLNPMAKQGKYEVRDEYTYQASNGTMMTLQDVPVLHWELMVNRAGVNIAGATIKDLMANDGDEFMELAPGSLKVYEVALNPDGTVEIPPTDATEAYNTVTFDTTAGEFRYTDAAKVDAADGASYCRTDGFSYKVPDASAYRGTLLFTFDTLLSDDVSSSNMKNSASIRGGGLSDDVTSPKADGAKDFFLDNYSSAEGVYFVKLHKISENQDPDDKKGFPLKGAEFELQTMTLPDKADSTNLANWTIDTDKTKLKHSNRRGNLTFLFLEPDTMYRVIEKTAPNGYKVVAHTWYFVPYLKDKEASDFPMAVSEEAGTTDPNDTTKTNTYTLELQTPGSHYIKSDAVNGLTEITGHKGGNVTFKKLGQNGQILPGVWFELSHNKGNISSQYAQSDKDGWVKFDNLDPLTVPQGYYVIQEMDGAPESAPEPPKGYRKWNGKMKVDVRLDGDDVVTTLSCDDGAFKANTTIGDDGSVGTLTNTPITHDLSFKKVDQNDDPVAGAEFTVQRRGDGGQKLDKNADGEYQVIVDVDNDTRIDAADKQTYVDYLPLPGSKATVDADGLVALTDLPYGDYMLTEQPLSDPLAIDDGKLIEIKATVDAAGVKMQWKEKSSADSDWSDLTNGGTVANELKTGTVQVNKQSANIDTDGKLEPTNIPLKATFAIYQDKGEVGTFESGTDSRLFSITTGDSGSFDWSAAANKDNAKKLILGKHYWLKETAVADSRFQIDTTEYPFELTTGSPDVYVGLLENGTIGQTTSEDAAFPNSPKYGGITLSKKSAGNSAFTVEGAEFDVQTKTAPASNVAQIVWDGTKGESGAYVLQPGASDGYADADATGSKYLYEKTDDDGNTSYQLLAGKYKLLETKVPDGYKGQDTTDNQWQFIITGGETAEVLQKIVTNTLMTGTVKIKKMIEKTESGVTYPLENADGTFEFNLNGEAQDGKSVNRSQSVRAADGTYSFANVPLGGPYAIAEDTTVSGISETYETPVTVYAKVEYDTTEKKVVTKYYTDEECENPIKPSDPKETPTLVNRVKYGNLEATKYLNYALTSTTGDGLDATCAGVTFKLMPTEKNDNRYAVTTGYTTTADAAGKVTFSNIPVGEYTLEEQTAPNGYKKMKPITVTIKDRETTKEGIFDGKTEPKDLNVVNDLLKTDVSFTKTDQNKIPLDGVVFDVMRQGDGGKLAKNADDSEKTGRYVFDFASTETAYETYAPCAEVTAETNGEVSLKDLVIGNYQLVETPGKNSSLGLDDDVITFFRVTENKDTAEEPNGTLKCIFYEDAAGTKQLDSMNDESDRQLMNILPYGNLEINKVVGNWTEDGNLKPDGKSLEGATFEVYRDNDNDGAIDATVDTLIFALLTTNVTGNFNLTDAQKQLLVAGKQYLLREKGTAGDQYQVDTTVNKFTPVKDSTTYIGMEPDDTPGTAYKPSTTDDTLVFPNGHLGYTPVKLEKVSATKNDTKLHGAEFEVYTQAAAPKGLGFKVASLKEDGETGTYLLAPADVPDEDVKTDGVGSKYLIKKVKDGKTYYLLLPGDYYIKETKAPEGYELPEDNVDNWTEISITCGDSPEIEIPCEIKLSNTIRMGTVEVTKNIEEALTKGSYRALQAGDEQFKFQISGTPIDNSSFPIDYSGAESTVLATAQSNSKAVFENIPLGDYTITEVLENGQTAAFKDPGAIKVNLSWDKDNNKVVVKYTAAGGTGTLDKDSVTVQNERKRGSVEASKVVPYVVDGETKEGPLAGATFALTSAADDTIKFTAISGEDGTISFIDVPVGTYTLAETACPDGYVVSSEPRTVLVTEDGTAKMDTSGEDLKISNTLIENSGNFKKVDQNGQPIVGIVFSIYRMGDGGTKTDDGYYNFDFTKTEEEKPYAPLDGKVTSDENGEVKFENLVAGTYILREEQADNPDVVTDSLKELHISVTGSGANGIAVTDEKSNTISEGANVANTLKTGTVNVHKVNANWNNDGTLTSVGKSMEGAEFAIYREIGTDNAYTPGADMEIVTGLKTNANGSFSSSDLAMQAGKLIVGRTYYLVETKAPDGYTLNGTPFSFVPEADKTIWLGSDGTDVKESEVGTATSSDADNTLVFVNGPEYYGKVKLEKKSSRTENPLHGAEFDVWTSVAGNDTKVARLVEEKGADEKGTGSYVLDKVSVLRGIFEGYDQNSLRKTEDGYELLAGTYWIQETKAPDGYQQPDSSDVWYFTIDRDNYISEISAVFADDGCITPKPFTNDIQKAVVSLKKQVEEEFTGSYIDLRDEDGSFEFEMVGTPSDASDGMTFDKRTKTAESPDGTVEFNDVPIGVYTITEVLTDAQKAIYKDAQTVKVTVAYDKDNQTTVSYEYEGKTADAPPTVKNALQKGSLKLQKQVSDRTNQGRLEDRPLAGAKFLLKSAEGAKFPYEKELVSGEDGIVAAQNLPVGVYTLTETEAPQGYRMGDVTKFTVNVTDGQDVTVDADNKELTLWNIPVKGFVKLEKVDAEDRTVSLDGAVFTLYTADGKRVCDLALEEEGGKWIYTLPDPQVAAKDNTDIWKYMTYYDEIDSSKPALYWGNYVLKETKAQTGYIQDKNEYSVKIQDDNRTVVVQNTADNSGQFTNRMAKGKITLTKMAEDISESLDGKMVPGEGFEFYIWGSSEAGVAIEDYLTAADITGAQSVTVESGGEKPGIHVVTGAGGEVVLNEVRVGSYHVAELENVKNNETGIYVRDMQVRDVRIELLEQSGETLPDDKKVSSVAVEVENRLKRGRIEGVKQKSGGKPLAGAAIGLFAADVTEFTEANLFYGKSAVSGDDGKFAFEDIPYGTYKVAELKAPSGYRLNEKTVFQVDITRDGVTVDAGYLAEPGKEMAAEATPIMIENTKKPSGGGGGGGGNPPTDPTEPNNPGPGVTPPEPTEPGDPGTPTEPGVPDEPGEPTEPGVPDIPNIPSPPGEKPNVPPGTIVEVHDPNDPDEPLYRGPYDPNEGFPNLPPGVYELITLDDHGVPLGYLMITIDEDGVPLALPKTGDTGIPIALLAAALIGSAAGAVLLRRRKEEDE